MTVAKWTAQQILKLKSAILKKDEGKIYLALHNLRQLNNNQLPEQAQEILEKTGTPDYHKNSEERYGLYAILAKCIEEVRHYDKYTESYEVNAGDLLQMLENNGYTLTSIRKNKIENVLKDE